MLDHTEGLGGLWALMMPRVVRLLNIPHDEVRTVSLGELKPTQYGVGSVCVGDFVVELLPAIWLRAF